MSFLVVFSQEKSDFSELQNQKSMEELGEEVSRVLNDMNSEVDQDEDSFDKFPLTDILTRLNKDRPRETRVSRSELEQVLTTLEEENKVMFIRDDEDPGVMLI